MIDKPVKQGSIGISCNLQGDILLQCNDDTQQARAVLTQKEAIILIERIQEEVNKKYQESTNEELYDKLRQLLVPYEKDLKESCWESLSIGFFLGLGLDFESAVFLAVHRPNDL